MFGIHLPGFLNPVNQLKSLASVAGSGFKNLEQLAELPVKELKHEASFGLDALTLNFSGAAKEAKGGVADAVSTGTGIVANDVKATKAVVKNAV